MKKRILCVVLSLIMLVSLVPAAALTASAAGQSTSESAITILKTLEGYSQKCTSAGYTGYGTLCTKSGAHTGHTTSEKEADAALREELKDLDKAVNTFASRYSLSLSQGQHDALVLFSFQNGTAWTTGTGDFQTAVKSGARGSAFLNAICWWNSSTADDNRRMIEANMYLNGVYSSTKPSRYIRVTYNVNGGKMSESEYQYYDTAAGAVANIVPTRQYHFFMGWYDQATGGKQVTSLKKGQTVYAHWQSYVEEPGEVKNVSYLKEVTSTTRLYDAPKGNKTDYYVKGNLTIDSEFIDNENVKWAHVAKAQKLYKGDKKQGEAMATDGWIKLGKVNFESGSGSSATNYDIDVTVTVTNSYLRVRAEDSIYSKELRQVHQGDQLRIVNTSSGDGFLWGQIADSDNDGVCEGWVALLYTNFEEVRGQSGDTNTSYNVIATATVVKPVNGYVNVRSDAGTNNQIVGALPYQSRVDIYEITYVNGIQWGRYSGGWFCLSYADVDGIDVDDYTNNSNVLAYAFVGDLANTWSVYQEPSSDASLIRTKETFKPKNLTITNLTREDSTGITWGKIAEGWVKVSDKDGGILEDGVTLDTAKYYTVVDGVTVRTAPSASADRVNNLVKGVEFNVNQSKQIIVVGDTIWGYADKVGENDKTYSGWINLASKYVARGDAPASGSNKKDDTPTGEMATIVGADKVNVRIHHDIYAKILGKISRGTTVAILGEEDGWYKLDYDVDGDDETDSWVSAKYVEVTKAASSNGTTGSTGSSDGSASVETGLGIVANTYSGVNVRTGAGTGNAQVGKLLPGTTVEILEVTTKGASKWGRIAQGWVCMDYITMVNNYEILGALTGGSTGSDSTVTGSEVAIYTGTIAIESANIRKTTSLDSDIVRTVTKGTPVTVHEILTVTKETSEVDPSDENKTIITKTTEYWARLNDGYLINPDVNLTLDALDEAVYTVTESDTLNVRSAAGTGNKIEFKLSKGDQVVITKVAIVNGSVWGFVEADAAQTYITDEDGKETAEYDWDGDGWISLAYCTKGAVSIKTETNNNSSNNSNTDTNTPVIGAGSDVGGFVTNDAGYRYTGKVINVTSTPLNVRASASDTAKVVTTLNNGANLVIYETYNDGVYAWGRCDAGWVYLYYVDLTPVVNGAVDARVVYNDNTIAYTDMNCSDVAGTYSRMSVIDIYEIVGKMARTDLGWVNTDNLL